MRSLLQGEIYPWQDSSLITFYITLIKESHQLPWNFLFLAKSWLACNENFSGKKGGSWLLCGRVWYDLIRCWIHHNKLRATTTQSGEIENISEESQTPSDVNIQYQYQLCSIWHYFQFNSYCIVSLIVLYIGDNVSLSISYWYVLLNFLALCSISLRRRHIKTGHNVVSGLRCRNHPMGQNFYFHLWWGRQTPILIIGAGESL